MGRSAKLFLAPWCLGVVLVSVVRSESTRTICHVDICAGDEFCDDGARQCRPCDNIRGDCLKDSLPVDCRAWCIGFLASEKVDQVLQSKRVEDCPDPGPLINGNYTHVPNFRHETTVTFTCDEGHRLFGANTSTCVDFKTWSAPLPVCEVTDCPDLGPLYHGTYTHASKYRHGTTVTFTCDVGYRRIGPSTSTCGDFKTWSNSLPVCEATDCPDLGPLEHGNYTYASNYRHGTTVTFTCDEGYRLFGANTSTCGDFKSWSAPLPVCEATDCPDLGPLEHGNYTHASSYPHGTTVTYTCDVGYRRIGLSTSTCGDFKTWSAPLPVCEATDCPDLGPLEHGNYTYASNYRHGTTVTFTCDVGYRLFGANTSTCGDFKSWSAPLPVCEATDCPDLGPLEHGNYTHASSYPHGTTVTYTCDVGYRRIGPSTSTCGDFKTWLSPMPECEESDVNLVIPWEIATLVLAVVVVIQQAFIWYRRLRPRRRQKDEDDEESGPGGSANSQQTKMYIGRETPNLDSSRESGIDTANDNDSGDVSGDDTAVKRVSGTGTVPSKERNYSKERASSSHNYGVEGNDVTAERGAGTGNGSESAENDGRQHNDGGQHNDGRQHNDGHYQGPQDNTRRSAGEGQSVVINHISTTVNYKSGNGNASTVAYKSNNQSNNVENSNNTNNDNDNSHFVDASRSNSKPEPAPQDACSGTERKSGETGSVDLTRAAKTQLPEEENKFGIPDSDLTTECRQPEEEGGGYELITNLEESYDLNRSSSLLNVRLSDASGDHSDHEGRPLLSPSSINDG
ncbi:P-selectin-like [Mya arenaria]|uniref:P-selectin-like n=1 Tax=Mya arenaria TaxID=6604 RepID=UPI0022E11A88|nr:P-selectin-like [Mya arenaria]